MAKFKKQYNQQAKQYHERIEEHDYAIPEVIETLNNIRRWKKKIGKREEALRRRGKNGRKKVRS